MSKDILTLQYSNEDDRAYGLAGMTITIAALDALDRVSSVTLDTDGPMVTFSNAYYFSGSPSISPKATWDNMIRNFHLTSAMVMANVMARSLVRRHAEVPAELMDTLKRSIAEEGRESCDLEDDEIDALFERTRSYTRRIFANPRVHPAVDSFARLLAVRRTLSGREIFDELESLQLI